MTSTKIEGRHALPVDATVYQKLVHHTLRRLVEISSMELIVAIIHCVLTAIAVFGLVKAGGAH